MIDYEAIKARLKAEVASFRAMVGLDPTVVGADTAKKIVSGMARPAVRHCTRCRDANVVFERLVTHHAQRIREKLVYCGVCSWVVESETWPI